MATLWRQLARWAVPPVGGSSQVGGRALVSTSYAVHEIGPTSRPARPEGPEGSFVPAPTAPACGRAGTRPSGAKPL